MLPGWERIAGDDSWRVAYAFDTALPGWLVLVPRRHVTAIADLTDAEARSLGVWQVRLSRALHQVLGCQKTYVAQFAEAAGFAHVHFHIVARPPDLAEDLRGPRIFRMLGPADLPHVSHEEMDRQARDLAEQLAGE
jgi:diadenosine tetraphosphate (Ap4A) HIT family hydrolase